MNESRVYKLWVLGRPTPKARPRKGKRNFYTPKRTKEWENLVAWKWIEKHGNGVAFPNGEVELKAVFYYSDRRTADIDNLAKSLADSLNGLAYADDKQVAHMDVTRVTNAEVEGVEIEVRPWDGGEGIAPAE